MIAGYPPHLWIEPYRDLIYRMCWAGGVSLVIGRDDAAIGAARELEKSGHFMQDGGPFATYGQTYVRFTPGDKLKVRELKHAY